MAYATELVTVTPEQVAAYLGKGDDSGLVALAGQHLPIVRAFVRAYTRGGGFNPSGQMNDDVAQVVVSATARLTANPEQVSRRQLDDYAESPAVLNGFTLPELAILHLYRRRTA